MGDPENKTELYEIRTAKQSIAWNDIGDNLAPFGGSLWVGTNGDKD
jgi:sugar lactone lactonase YvrE